jgi:hypothetical protein
VEVALNLVREQKNWVDVPTVASASVSSSPPAVPFTDPIELPPYSISVFPPSMIHASARELTSHGCREEREYVEKGAARACSVFSPL